MEKFRIKISVLGQCLALVLFAAVALASSSSKDVYNHVDDFVEGWNYGKSLSDATNEVEVVELDSIATEQPMVANAY
ncbi:MAG: hypothetical protein K2G27_04405 [Duncaniella sp.]|nr:hypothetical protein [Duncaniella sp.]